MNASKTKSPAYNLLTLVTHDLRVLWYSNLWSVLCCVFVNICLCMYDVVRVRSQDWQCR